MAKKICIFVDGENFRHSIVELFEEFRQEEYLPKNANWEDFFTFLINKCDDCGERVRTYWYVVEHIDFYPYKYPTSQERLKSLLCKHNPFRNLLNNLQGIELRSKMNEIVKGLKINRNMMLQRFNGWTSLQNGISTKHSFIEFRKSGAIQYNVFSETLGVEKAVDVKLATDMIVLQDIYDIAVIVSGDQDYVPAVQIIKDLGKHVINVSFETRGGKLLPGGAWRLNKITDWNLRIKYDEFRPYLNLPLSLDN